MDDDRYTRIMKEIDIIKTEIDKINKIIEDVKKWDFSKTFELYDEILLKIVEKIDVEE